MIVLLSEGGEIVVFLSFPAFWLPPSLLFLATELAVTRFISSNESIVKERKGFLRCLDRISDNVMVGL